MSKSKIIINDHWPDMRQEGFVSMKTFEFMANKAFFITDRVLGMEEISKDIICYEKANELPRLIRHYTKLYKQNKCLAITSKLYSRYQEIHQEALKILQSVLSTE